MNTLETFWPFFSFYCVKYDQLVRKPVMFNDSIVQAKVWTRSPRAAGEGSIQCICHQNPLVVCPLKSYSATQLFFLQATKRALQLPTSCK